jgi:energy-coupling factor transporter ATP-binding protein EcfA2
VFETLSPPTEPEPASSTEDPTADNVVRSAVFGGANEGATSTTDGPVPAVPPTFADLNGIADDEKERDFARDNPKSDEPWPDAVDGAATLDEIAAFLNEYMEMPPGGTDLVTLFPPTAFALHRCEFDYAPRLMIVGEKDSGKSNLMKILSGLCPRPYLSSDITKAPLFRTVHERKPTILIDESHLNLREHPELLTVLHQGWDYETARTTRLHGKATQTFYTFAIAILAGVGDWGGDELKSRSFIIELIRSNERSIPKFLTRPNAARLERLRRKMLRWTRDNREILMTVEPELPTLVSRNRIGDLASTLLRVADVAGGEWPQRARDAISMIAAENVIEDDDLGRTLLTALCETIHDPDLILHYQNAEGQTPKRKALEADFFWTVELVKVLNSRHDLPFEKLNGHQIGRIFRAYRRAKIRSGQRMLGGRGTPNWKGYHRADLERAFDLYGIKPSHPVIVTESGPSITSAIPNDAMISEPADGAPKLSAIPLDGVAASSGIALPDDAPII